MTNYSAPSKVARFVDLAGSFATDTIADCIQKNSYKEEKCQNQINALYECCNLFYQQRGDDANTVSCPKATLLRLKMRQRREGP